VHEVGHGKTTGDRNSGRIHPYQIVFERKVPEEQAKHIKRKGVIPPVSMQFEGRYESLVGADELVTYRAQLRETVREYIQALRKKSPEAKRWAEENIIATINFNTVRHRIATSSDVSIQAIQAIEKLPSPFNQSTTFSWGGRTYQTRAIFAPEAGAPHKVVTLLVEEIKKPHDTSLKVASFKVHFPVGPDFSPGAHLPEAMQSQLGDLLAATDRIENDLEKVEPILLELYSGATPSEKLLGELREATRTKEVLPGYPDRRPGRGGSKKSAPSSP
jgi:hypothetical protein